MSRSHSRGEMSSRQPSGSSSYRAPQRDQQRDQTPYNHSQHQSHNHPSPYSSRHASSSSHHHSGYARSDSSSGGHGGGGGKGSLSSGPIRIGSMLLPNVVQQAPPQPAHPTALVQCRVHGRRRLAKCCERIDVRNADGHVISYVYQCAESDVCNFGRGSLPPLGSEAATTLAGGAAGEASTATATVITKKDAKSDDDEDFDPMQAQGSSMTNTKTNSSDDEESRGLPPRSFRQRLAATEGVRHTTTGAEPPASPSTPSSAGLGLAAATSLPPSLFGGSTAGAESGPTANVPTSSAAPPRGGPARFYDFTKAGDRDVLKKVCWSCGMESHEKPDCHNLLCKACHSPMAPGYEGRMSHRCEPVAMSPFVLLDTQLLDDFMAAEDIRLRNEEALGGGSSKKKKNKKNTNKKKGKESRSREGSEASSVMSDLLDEAAFINPALLTTRCPRCHRFGHLDCPHKLSAHHDGRPPNAQASDEDEEEEESLRQRSCCYCADTGHTGFACPKRPRDHWRSRVLLHSAQELGDDLVRKLVATGAERLPNGEVVQHHHSSGSDNGGSKRSRGWDEDGWDDGDRHRSAGRGPRHESHQHQHSGRHQQRRGDDSSDDDDRRHHGRSHHSHHSSSNPHTHRQAGASYPMTSSSRHGSSHSHSNSFRGNNNSSSGGGGGGGGRRWERSPTRSNYNQQQQSHASHSSQQRSHYHHDTSSSRGHTASRTAGDFAYQPSSSSHNPMISVGVGGSLNVHRNNHNNNTNNFSASSGGSNRFFEQSSSSRGGDYQHHNDNSGQRRGGGSHSNSNNNYNSGGGGGGNYQQQQSSSGSQSYNRSGGGRSRNGGGGSRGFEF